MVSSFKFRFPISKRHEGYIAAFYSLACALLVNWAHRQEGVEHAIKLQQLLVTLWSGFVLAISLMEAWVKFRAPLLRRHIAVDVGRHIFACLNIVECILMTTIGILRVVANTGVPIALFATVSTILIFEILVVTPTLDALAKFRITQALSGSTVPAEVKYVSELKEELRALCPAKPYWHFIYVALEIVKVLILFAIISRMW